VFSGGWTHSANGATPNGTNAYADTKLIANSVLSLNSTSIGVYSRTNSDILAPSIANVTGGQTNEASLFFRSSDTTFLRINGPTSGTTTTTDSRGFFIANRVNSTQINLSKNGVQTTYASNASLLNNLPILLGGYNGSSLYDNKQQAFAFIGDGLTAQNMTDLTTAVQAFQTTLGRSIGTQTVSDADAQAFVTAADIQDQVEANAINNLVIGLKADGLWTKMQALYPFVGGTNAQHTWNLKNTAQFQISWQGGVTSSANGVQFNGMNSYGITGLTPSTTLTLNNGSLSFYSRTNSNSLGVEIGSRITGSDVSLGIYGTTPLSGSINTFIDSAQLTVTDTLGFYQITRTGGSTQKVFKNTSSNLKTISATTPALTQPIYLGCLNNNGAAAFYSNRQCAFASIGDGLSDTEATNLNSRVQTFQTALNRNV
jgi:hypothetical protein